MLIVLVQCNQTTHRMVRNDPPKTMFLRDRNGFPVACVAIHVPKNGKIAYYALSTYNPHDKFSKTVARDIAVQRVLTLPLGFAQVQPGMHKYIVRDIHQNPTLPKRARRAAWNWLKTHYDRRFV